MQTLSTTSPKSRLRRTPYIRVLTALVALVLGVVVAPGSAQAAYPGPASCPWYMQAEAPTRLFYMPMSNGLVDAVTGGGYAYFHVCRYGAIYVHWSPSLHDNGSLSFFGARMQFLTNRGRVVTSTRDYRDGVGWEIEMNRELSHYDVLAGEYPVRTKFIYYGSAVWNTGRIVGTFNKTCTVHYQGSGASTCTSGPGVGGW
jgi:hypothetical protein